MAGGRVNLKHLLRYYTETFHIFKKMVLFYRGSLLKNLTNIFFETLVVVFETASGGPPLARGEWQLAKEDEATGVRAGFKPARTFSTASTFSFVSNI